MLDVLPVTPETVVVDVSQLFYHTVWPHGGNLSNLIACIQSKISRYPDATEKIIVFDKYNDTSAKDHERMRRAGEVVVDYELSITSPLPKRDAILKSKNNKRRLASVLCTFSMDNNVTMETRDDGAFSHDEADVTMVSYVIQAASHGKSVIRVLSDDTDVFVLLVYWVHRAGLQCKVQMERWDGTVLDINATCADLGEKCFQLLGMHALSGCDTVSYPYGKGKISALNTLLTGNFPGLAHELGEVDATHTDLMEAAQQFFCALYRQPSGTSMENARFKLFTKKKKATKIMALPPTSANLLLHVLRAHLQVMLWKAADQQAPPDQSSDITHFGWIIQNDIPIPAIAPGAPAPPELIDLIKCSCKAQGKRCSSEACSCHKKHVPCTSYCNCSGGEDCCNPHSVRPGTSSEEDENEADDDYFESDTAIEDEEEGESGDVHDENCIIAEEDFELDML